MKFILKLIIPFFIFCFTFSCEKDDFYTSSDVKLKFSNDTILFDTVFTTIGSSTKKLVVKNPYTKSVQISSISLAGGETSPYRLNIDGLSGTKVNNIELRSKDSLYIFIEVTIDPLNHNLPMVVNDSILFSINQKVQDVDLISWGQDVHILNSKIIQTETWINDKPYLIYNYLFVDTASTLTIEQGVKLHFHKESRMYVAGTLVCNGTFESPIIFEGDRLEKIYEDIPGQWDGIWMLPGSRDNAINFTEIRNAIIGIQVDTLASLDKPTLMLSNSKIENMTSTGLYAQGTTIEAFNTLIANCGQFTAALTLGGSYEFNHCTFANYWGYSTRSTPSVLLNNYYIDIHGNTQVRPLNKAFFGNSIIYGNKETEIILDENATGDFNYYFDHSLIKVDANFNTSDPDFFENILKNEDPKFKDPYEYNYKLDTLSIAKDYGKIEIGQQFPLDINLNNRTIDNGPDLGAFERVELN
ncbi:MAG: hypothetical protein A2X13_02965 [Bacteroidetes bacterium GWC2_33_15]|nr:MAG: hypothetical protein A2X10_09500 [Bacteroidetes bacterium GWA2_33_15]OFX49510.1 MAG: hypothetical protein A2X13_02965 [Bacteroidetes bacterium GWC2_33_15]OFX63651.1 MAG: hypothetical protein A2X15_01260 [Bacteroidetes bacterium GWB2_32_14]OFX68865.1 MAG: hypothetical protein A2X14_13255 [Bacteroidetes bacterium GWD2_33_33]HAN17535.1 hypothetical protein [Bacteroidales bacterium]